MENATAAPETEQASPSMDTPPPHARPNPVVQRKLGELEAWLAKALSPVDDRLFPETKARVDFLRSLMAAERDTHVGARPRHLVDAEERFGALESTFEEWARSVAAAAEEEEEEADDQAGAGSGSSAGCSCNDSCSGGFEFTGPEVVFDFDHRCDAESGDAAEAHKAAVTEAAPATTGTAARRRWWRRCAALCGAAGVVAVIALGAGLALQFATVAPQHSVNLVPT